MSLLLLDIVNYLLLTVKTGYQSCVHASEMLTMLELCTPETLDLLFIVRVNNSNKETWQPFLLYVCKGRDYFKSCAPILYMK